ncbi:MAG: hypothetical protein D6728_18365 [Cyanobacteria bacterium J055]|nr:MAG: hypothetical protein D6728_18365 [Cyanobacteria bacterium J055]
MRTINGCQSIPSIDNPKSSSAGYTAIELLVITIILGILAAIAIPNFLKFLEETKINLLAEQVRQFLRDAQRQAIGDGRSYAVRFQKKRNGITSYEFSPGFGTPNLDDPIGWYFP